MLEHPAKMNIRVFGDNEESVDAEVLARILQGVQRAVHIAAMDANDSEPASSGYIPQGIQ